MESIGKLCLIDFQGDTTYKAIELQQVKQESFIHYIVLMGRQDSESDIYYTKGLKIYGDRYKSLLNKVTIHEVDSMKVTVKLFCKSKQSYDKM